MAVREFNAPQRHAAKTGRITQERQFSAGGQQHVHPQTPQNCGPFGQLVQRKRNPKFSGNIWCVAQSVAGGAWTAFFPVLWQNTGKSDYKTRKSYSIRSGKPWKSAILDRISFSKNREINPQNRETLSEIRGNISSRKLGTVGKSARSTADPSLHRTGHAPTQLPDSRADTRAGKPR